MTELDQAVLNLLTARWEVAKEIVSDLRHDTEAGRVKVKWMPGQVLDSLDRLCLLGKAEMSPDGYRLMVERPAAKVDPQKNLFG